VSTQHGLVLASYRRHYTVRLDDGDELSCMLKGRDTTLACGDRVRVARIAGGGVIESALPRDSLLYRSDGFKDRLIAANVTLIVGVVAPDVALDEELVHRWIIAAEAAHCRLIIAANKGDHPASAALLARLAPIAALGYPVIALAAKESIAPLASSFEHARTVLIGASGVGKSTILNTAVCLEPPHAPAAISTALRTGPPHDEPLDAASASRRRQRSLDHRFPGHQGVRPRPSRARGDRRRIRRRAIDRGRLQVSRLPSRSRAGLRPSARRSSAARSPRIASSCCAR
jgi:hypothetical protein